MRQIDISENEVLGPAYRRGWEEGFKEGFEQGFLKGQIKLLRFWLELRFGQLTPEHNARLAKLQLVQIDSIFDQCCDACSLDELLPPCVSESKVHI